MFYMTTLALINRCICVEWIAALWIYTMQLNPMNKMKHPTEDIEDIWRKAVEEWCIVNWLDGMQDCKTVHDARKHLHKMMNYEFKMRLDPAINGGFKYTKEEI